MTRRQAPTVNSLIREKEPTRGPPVRIASEYPRLALRHGAGSSSVVRLTTSCMLSGGLADSSRLSNTGAYGAQPGEVDVLKGHIPRHVPTGTRMKIFPVIRFPAVAGERAA